MKLLVLPLLFAVSLAHAESFPSAGAGREFTNKIMARIATGDIQGGMKLMKPYTVVPPAEFDAMVGQTAAQLPTITQRFGKSVGQEFISESKVGESLVRLVYIQRFERHALRWRFYLYKSSKGWVINSFNFDDRIHDLFPQ